MSGLGDLVRLARERKGWTQNQLAEELGKSKQWISLIERGEQLPSPALLVAIYEKCLTTFQEPDVELAGWLLQWLESKTTDLELGEHAAALRKAVRKATAVLSASPAPIASGGARSLEDFPGSFAPLTVICGDRREFPAATRGDLLVNSAAITDVQFLPGLALPPSSTIKSDKAVMLMQEDDLRREFGHSNLLVIGSPAVNLAARVINDGSIFRFLVSEERRAQNRILKNDKQLNDPETASLFSRLLARMPAPGPADRLEDAEASSLAEVLVEQAQGVTSDRTHAVTELLQRVLEGSTPDGWIDGFRKPGLLDPTSGAVYGRQTRDDQDFSVISLAANPYAETDDYVSILVGGIHGPGTAHAVRALAHGDFRGRALGGVIEVSLDLYGKDWPRRFQTAEWEWCTDLYSPESIISCLQSVLSKEPGRVEWPFSELSRQEIAGCAEFVKHTSGS